MRQQITRDSVRPIELAYKDLSDDDVIKSIGDKVLPWVKNEQGANAVAPYKDPEIVGVLDPLSERRF